MIHPAPCVLVFGLLVLSLVASPSTAQDKQMYWSALHVSARLDGDGRLHVQERHEMVFNGDWNGGYRRFRVPGGQELDLHGVRRIDARSGREVPLVVGDVDRVDHYAREGASVRWRSRLPSDPPFVMQRLTYVLDYTLSYILTSEEDGVFRLSHDFAFPDRDGLIERVHVDLELDQAWQPLDDWPATLSRESLLPGESLILDARLRHTGAVAPAGVWLPASRAARVAIMAAVTGACGLLFGLFLYREARLGRFRPLQSPQAIDAAWLEENLFRFLPEEAGAAWDGRIGPPEVAAILARLVAEGKLETTIKESWFLIIPIRTLTMRITPAGKTGKRSYEATLVQKLFVKGGIETDTDKIRDHYRHSGFDPAAQIRAGLETALRRHPELCDTRPAPPRWPIVSLLAVAAAVALVGAVQQPDAIAAALVTLIGCGGVFVLSNSCARWWRQRLTRWWLSTPLLLITALIPTAALAAVSFTNALTPLLRPDFTFLIGLAGLAVGIFAGTLRSAASLDGPQRLAARQRLAAARRFLARELRQPAPRLRDDWFPYVVAFGLGARAARWFRRFGGATQTVGRGSGGTWTSGGSTSSGPASSGTWSGGAGKFGGAGAGGAWVAALGTVAAGVSEPSKGGGSGGGGGGGSSSGGGGGGGW
jgi:uncharacterized membrane protein YgcG